MQNNYERLLDQLSQLLSEQQVQDNLDKKLKPRIHRLYAQKGKKYIMQKINDLSKNDPQELFNNSMDEDISNRFERIVLKQKNESNRQNRKHLSNLTLSKQKKQFFQKPLKKEGKSIKNSNRLLTEKSKQKLKKNLASYSTLVVNNKSKSKQRSKSKYNPSDDMRQSESKSRLKTFSSERTGKKLSMFEKNDKQNVILYSKFKKNERSNSKIEEDKDFTNLYLTKKKSNLSNVDESKSVLKKLAVLQTEPSRLKLSSNKYQRQPKKQNSIDKQINFFQAINSRQEEVNDQKNQLEEMVKKFKQKIQKQQIQLTTSTKNIERYQKQMSKIIGSKDQYALQVQISRKKSENFFTQAKQIEKKIIQTNKTNDTFIANITQEKYLIDMYQTVIEEMKIQLKIQQQEKIDIKKKIMLIKNTEKMVAEKYISRKGLSEQIFESMKQSLKKWG